MNISAPALRPYLETIEKQCRALDRENLIQLILTMAKQVDPGKRTDFLVNFQSHLPTAKKEKSTGTAHPAQLHRRNLKSSVSRYEPELYRLRMEATGTTPTKKTGIPTIWILSRSR